MSDLATLESNVAGVLGLDFDANSPSSGDGPRLLGWANDAVIDLLNRTQCYVQVAELDLTVGVQDYRLDPAVLAIADVFTSTSDTNYRLRRMSTTDLMNQRLFDVNSSPVQMYAMSGADLLMIYPTPSEDSSITIYYVAKPTPLSAPTDDPSDSTLGGIPSEYHYGLELYMMWKAGGFSDDETSQAGETYRKLYLGDPNTPPGTEQRKGFVGSMKKDLRDKGGKQLGGVLIPPRSRRIAYVPPGVDVGSYY